MIFMVGCGNSRFFTWMKENLEKRCNIEEKESSKRSSTFRFQRLLYSNFTQKLCLFNRYNIEKLEVKNMHIKNYFIFFYDFKRLFIVFTPYILCVPLYIKNGYMFFWQKWSTWQNKSFKKKNFVMKNFVLPSKPLIELEIVQTNYHFICILRKSIRPVHPITQQIKHISITTITQQ